MPRALHAHNTGSAGAAVPRGGQSLRGPEWVDGSAFRLISLPRDRATSTGKRARRMDDGISLQSAVALAVGLLVIFGTFGKYLWGLQRELAEIKKQAEDRATAMERRIQVLELTSLQGPAFTQAMESMRNWMSMKLDSFQRDLHELTTTVAQLVDREGGVSYRPPTSLSEARKDRAG